MQKSYYQQLPLLPLGPEATKELLVDLLGTDSTLRRMTELIRESRADGLTAAAVRPPRCLGPRESQSANGPEARQRQLFAAGRRLVHAQSRREPTVSLIEDPHWIDQVQFGSRRSRLPPSLQDLSRLSSRSRTFMRLQGGYVVNANTIKDENFGDSDSGESESANSHTTLWLAVPIVLAPPRRDRPAWLRSQALWRLFFRLPALRAASSS